MSAKAELSDLQYEQQREMEGLLDSIRSLTRELKLQETIIDAFIPRQYQASNGFFASSPARTRTFLCCFHVAYLLSYCCVLTCAHSVYLYQPVSLQQ